MRKDTENEKPAGTESDGLNLVHGEKPGNVENDLLEHTTASRTLRNPAPLVNSKPTEIHDGNRKLKEEIRF